MQWCNPVHFAKVRVLAGVLVWKKMAPIVRGTIGRCSLDGVGVAFSEEEYHWWVLRSPVLGGGNKQKHEVCSCV